MGEIVSTDNTGIQIAGRLAAQYDWLARRFFRASPRPFDTWAARADTDTRRGVTVIGRFSDSTMRPVGWLLADLEERLAGHLVYPAASAHFTIIVPVPAGRLFTGDPTSYVPIVRAVAGVADDFGVDVDGVSVAGSAVILRGFPIGGGLERMRQSLRSAFAAAGLPNLEAVDECYDGAQQPRWTAHVTVARLCYADDALERKLKGLRNLSCALRISRVETVRHDEYLSPAKSVLLDAIDLRNADSVSHSR